MLIACRATLSCHPVLAWIFLCSRVEALLASWVSCRIQWPLARRVIPAFPFFSFSAMPASIQYPVPDREYLFQAAVPHWQCLLLVFWEIRSALSLPFAGTC